MKFSVLALTTITAALLTACSGVITPKAELAQHDPDHNIPAIDHMIVDLKQEYIDKCYMPVAKHHPPENSCQTELFQLVERRNMNYNQNHVAMAANTLLFRDIDKKIVEMTRNDPDVRSAIRTGAFTNTNDMLAYYHEKYQFDTQLEKF